MELEVVLADFDVIVVGSGMSGGWVAKELCEQGFKVAVIERGRKIEPEKDYTDFEDPWTLEHFGWTSPQDKELYPIQSESYAFKPYTRQFWVKDAEYPYETPEGHEYSWKRGYQEGGRSIMWGRQSYRWSALDFESNAKDGHGIDWPVRYDDIAPWYDHVEKFAGIAGSYEDLEILPDSVFQPAFDLNCLEKRFKERVEVKFDGRKIIPARVAHLTKPTEEQMDLGRGQCQVRNRCFRGCSFGAYFSSNSATLPAAERTGNYTLLTDMAVHSVVYDKATNRTTGVKVLNTKTRATKVITARTIFLNASTIGTTTVLLNSQSEEFPNGLANSSGQLGRNLLDHITGTGAYGVVLGGLDKYYKGNRPSGFYVPRYRNYTEPGDGYERGFGFQGAAFRLNWGVQSQLAGVGSDFKSKLRHPGAWIVTLGAFGEVLPNPENTVSLHAEKVDADGLPVPIIKMKFGQSDLNLAKQAQADAVEMLKAVNAVRIETEIPGLVEGVSPPGSAIHEMGTARMGNDPKESVLNKWNQAHDVPNLFVTDGSFMCSAACQNPSLTYMAFSVRAAHHAGQLMRDGVI